MKKKLSYLLILGALVTLSACSSSPMEGDELDAEEDLTSLDGGDAGTDALPQDGVETPEESADLADSSALPAPEDPAAAPPVEAQPEVPPADPMTTAEAVPMPEAATPETATATPEVTPEVVPPAPTQVETATAETPAPSTDGGGDMTDYTVQSGDTLMKIAFETYGDLYKWKDIYEANQSSISDPNAIPSGVVLKIEKPATPVTVERYGEKYMIRRGDTLGTISNEVYGTPSKWKTLWENNKQLIKDPNRIFAGFYLYYVPDANQPEVNPAPLAEAAPAQPEADSNRLPSATTDGGVASAAQVAPAMPETPAPVEAPAQTGDVQPVVTGP